MVATSKENFCRVPKSQLNRAARNRCQWEPGYVIKWGIAPRTQVGSFSRMDLVPIISACWAQWSAIADVRTEYVTNSRNWNIEVQSRQIDGAGGILAQAQLPCGRVTPATKLFLQFDVTDRWANAENPPRAVQDILRVGTHEGGHNLGLDHAPQGSRNLMAPTVSNIRGPSGQWDKAQILSRHGPPITSPDHPDTGNGTRDGFLIAGAYMNDLSVDVYLLGEKVKTISFEDFLKQKAKLLKK